MDEYFIPEGWSPAEPMERKIPSKFKKQIHPWIKQLLQADPAKAREIIRDRLESISDERLLPIRDRLLEFREFGVTFCAQENDNIAQYVGFGGTEWDPFYLPTPVEKNLVVKALNLLGYSRIDGIQNFIEAYDGLRNLPPGCAGNFSPIAEWRVLKEHSFFVHIDDEKLDARWLDATPLYYGPNGDILLLTSKNELGWYCIETQNVKRRKGKFADFIEYYCSSAEAVDSWSDPASIFKNR